MLHRFSHMQYQGFLVCVLLGYSIPGMAANICPHVVFVNDTARIEYPRNNVVVSFDLKFGGAQGETLFTIKEGDRVSASARTAMPDSSRMMQGAWLSFYSAVDSYGNGVPSPDDAVENVVPSSLTMFPELGLINRLRILDRELVIITSSIGMKGFEADDDFLLTFEVERGLDGTWKMGSQECRSTDDNFFLWLDDYLINRGIIESELTIALPEISDLCSGQYIEGGEGNSGGSTTSEAAILSDSCAVISDFYAPVFIFNGEDAQESVRLSARRVRSLITRTEGALHSNNVHRQRKELKRIAKSLKNLSLDSRNDLRARNTFGQLSHTAHKGLGKAAGVRRTSATLRKLVRHLRKLS